MFKSKFNPDGSMYQLDGGAVIKALLVHSTYLQELGVVDKGQLGGKEDLVAGGCCATYGNAGKGFINHELLAGSDNGAFHTPGCAFMANGGDSDIGNMIPYEHKVLYVKEGVNFLKILLFLVVKEYSFIPLSNTNKT